MEWEEKLTMKLIRFGEIEIGPGEPPYIIAEVGSNHNGDMDLCRRLIDAAATAGAHAVKFQSWTDTSLIAEEEYARNTEYSDKKKHFGSLREMAVSYTHLDVYKRQGSRSCTPSCRRDLMPCNERESRGLSMDSKPHHPRR